MGTIPMRDILGIFLAFVVCCQCQLESPGVSSSWAKLQISPDTLSSMKYGNFLIEIYEHANNHKATTTASQKKYYYSPLALLNHNSAVSRLNRVTKQSEMRFHIEMWNDKVENEVVKHLNKIVGQEIQSDKVRVIPLEKVILTSNTPTEGYSLSPVWTNYDKSKTLRLSLSCYDQKVCDELANEMRSDPEQFDHLKLLYSLSSQTSQTKQTTISIESVTSGQMVTNLLQKFGDKKEIFLTANDEKKMLTETATNIRMETFDDSEVGSPDTESHLYNILKDLLITSRTTIKEQSDKMWDSVFWDEDNYRPDKTTKTLNEIINKLDTETQTKLADMFQKAEKQSGLIEKLTSSNTDVEKRREQQLSRENQTKDANENEVRRSQATDQEQFSRNQTRNETSQSNKVNVEGELGANGSLKGDATILGFIPANFDGSFGFRGKIGLGLHNHNTNNTDQQNEKRENAMKNSDEQNRNLENKERIQHNYDANSWANVDKISSAISGKMANDSDSSRRVEILKEDVEKLLQESKNHVEWDGEKFVPKPLQLSRINLGKFRDSQSFQDRNVRVRYTTAELSAPIKFVEHAELTVTDEWNNLKEQLKDAVMNLGKTNIELIDVRRDLTKKLEGTNLELEKTQTELKEMRVYVDYLSIKLNATVKEVTEMKVSLRNFSLEPTGTKQELEKTQTELKETRVYVDYLSTKLNATEKELTEMNIRAGYFSTELIVNSQRLGHEIKIAEDNLRKELRATLNSLETTTTILNATRTELRSTKSDVGDFIQKLNARTNEIVDIGKMPSSCADLERMGHKLSGIFLLKGSNKMEMIYCDFNSSQNDKQKWIGYADVKSAPVHFDVQRNSFFNTTKTPIPFQSAVVNEGNAMNLTSGKFTAPRTGIYFFSFTGMAVFPASSSFVGLGVGLYLNGDRIGRGYVEEANTVANQDSPLTLQSTLNLKKDDKVWVVIDGMSPGVYLYDSSWHYTHFTGFMLEEEIVASL